MTKVFIADVSKLNSDISVYKDLVSSYRFEKAMGLKNELHRLQSIGCELLLAEFLGRVPKYYIDEFGKPTGENVNFNFSHSGIYSVCAVSDGTVGVDIEKIRNVNIEIAKKKFLHKEYEEIINSKNPDELFMEYWLKKESYAKALGRGTRIPFDSFDINNISDFRLCTFNMNDYKICVCSEYEAEICISSIV